MRSCQSWDSLLWDNNIFIFIIIICHNNNNSTSNNRTRMIMGFFVAQRENQCEILDLGATDPFQSTSRQKALGQGDGAQRWHQVTQAFALVALDFDVPWR